VRVPPYLTYFLMTSRCARMPTAAAVFVFHCTRFFDTEGWHLKNAGRLLIPTLPLLLYLKSERGQLITVISFPLILALYELLVRPFNVVRFFFGMRPRQRPAKEPRLRLA